MKTTFIGLLTWTILSMASVNAQVLSDFSTDVDNWHSEGDGDYYWEAGTGNPGGCFRVDDDATGDWNNAIAPVKFLGDWSAATTSDYITADIFLHLINGSYGSGIFVFEISGPGGKARAFSNVQPPLDTWTTYTANLDPASWVMASGTWELMLQQVSQVIVRAEYINGDEYNRIDNVGLSFTPAIIPVEPTLCSDFEDGLYGGWSFSSTGGVTINTTEGNPGKCIRITDGTGVSKAYPAPKYLGDWNQLDNHGADIRMDIKITGISGTTLISDYFLRIAGPGGVATFPMDNSVELAFNRYHTFVFPVEESYWTVESGTWGGLINHVNSFEMIVEYISGAEVVWLDNFCISDLPPVAGFEADKFMEFAGNTIQFTDLSVQGPTTWDWDFGDGQTSADQHPAITYPAAGIYDVALTAANFFGTDTETKTSFIEILDPFQCQKFNDDFNDNSINPIWWLKNGTWSEASGNIRQTSNHFVTGNLLGGCFAVTGSPYWQDYVLSCDMYSTDNDAIGLVFNWQDEQNMYMFHWNLETPYKKIYKWVDGTSTTLASDEIPYAINTWYHLDVYSVGGKLVLSVDGTEVLSVEDNSFLAGKAGLFCSGNEGSYWDNFNVECPGTPLELKAYLEGPFNGTDMNTTLLDSDRIPHANPYTASPWNHTGTEGIQDFTNPGLVDWVLVDLRDAPSPGEATPATSIGMQAGLLLSGGEIISPYGGLPLYVKEDIANNLYVVIMHRNHLPVMSSGALTESGGIYSWDFTTGAGQAYGTGSLRDLGGGVYGMPSGDLNADGSIDLNDKILAWQVEAGLQGYLPTDGNLDGQTDNIDKNDGWLGNIGLNSNVPQ